MYKNAYVKTCWNLMKVYFSYWPTVLKSIQAVKSTVYRKKFHAFKHIMQNSCCKYLSYSVFEHFVCITGNPAVSEVLKQMCLIKFV